MSTGGSYAFQLLGSVIGTGVVTTAVNALINRRKMSADTVAVLDKAASNAVQRTEDDNTRLRTELRGLRGENEELWSKARSLEHENATLIDVVRDLTAHARRQAAEIRRLGGRVDDPPELPAELVGTNTGPQPIVPEGLGDGG